ncbi:hypothetical protein ACFX2K_046800 [Malus domestica]
MNKSHSRGSHSSNSRAAFPAANAAAMSSPLAANTSHGSNLAANTSIAPSQPHISQSNALQRLSVEQLQ